MPSKLDPYLDTIEGWMATEPQITALAIVRRFGEIDPTTFRDNQHSIVQRLLRSLRSKAAETALAGVTDQVATAVAAPPGSVDGAASRMLSAPPTAPPAEQVATKLHAVPIVRPKPMSLNWVTFLREAIRPRGWVLVFRAGYRRECGDPQGDGHLVQHRLRAPEMQRPVPVLGRRHGLCRSLRNKNRPLGGGKRFIGSGS